MSKIVLYTTHCPKCEVLATKLTQKNITYELCEDTEKVMELLDQIKMRSIPILQVNEEYLTFEKAIEWVNQQ